jgi:hypothetical protein
MGKETSARFTISYDAAKEIRLAEEVLDVLDTAYNRIGADLDHYPDARIPVILYTRQEFHATTSGPDWSGGIYDGKIRFPIGGIREITPPLRASFFRVHHVVVRELSKESLSTWLNEGLAVIERGGNMPHAMNAGLESLFPATGRLIFPRKQGRTYRQSHAMVSIWFLCTAGIGQGNSRQSRKRFEYGGRGVIGICRLRPGLPGVNPGTQGHMQKE